MVKPILSVLLAFVSAVVGVFPCSKVQMQIDGKYKLCQQPKSFLRMLEKENIELIRNEGTNDGRTVEWDNYFWYDSKDIRAHFNPKGCAVSFTVLTPKYATNFGVKAGDSTAQMLEIYGNNYTQDEYNVWYFYTKGKYCIGFRVEGEKIECWSIFIPSDQGSEP